MTTPEPPSYIDLTLPVDTIAAAVNHISLAVSLVDDMLIGQVIINTDDGYYRFLLGGESFNSLIDQAVKFDAIHADPDATTEFVAQLRRNAANQ
jgi:hypothetical protein